MNKQDFFILPEKVKSPKNRISGDIKVLRRGEAGDWSLVKLTWDGENRYGIRWNGNDNDNGIGNPQSRGVPTWFILPDEIGSLIEANRNLCNSLSKEDSTSSNMSIE